MLSVERIKEILLATEPKGWLAGKKGERHLVSLTIEWGKKYIVPFDEELDCYYVDEYSGGLRFSGFDRIISGGKAVWGRGYYGVTSPTGDYTEKIILDWVRQKRVRLMPSLWNGVTAFQSPLVDDIVFVIRFQRPGSVSFDNFIYHEWILSNHREEDEEENEGVLFHRVCVGGVIS